MQPTVSAFKWVPPFAQGLVRDLRVRWAMHEAGRGYEVQLIGPQDQASNAYRELQPFGQVPAYYDDGVILFESGAIVLHIADSSPQLLPENFKARTRAKAWMFAALNTVEPPITVLHQLQQMGVESDNAMRLAAVAAVERSLDSLAAWLGDRAYLEDDFTAGDLLMTTVLRNLRGTDVLDNYPTLAAYQQRCEAREAFQRALGEQLQTFADYQPTALMN
ncbi:MAG TPA: glutathione S-transferase family protein [Methylovirgula sp.]|jgi:glutathione S-transferase|nr:glutathione S-transferase family protein [Methylovirgula sp.]